MAPATGLVAAGFIFMTGPLPAQTLGPGPLPAADTLVVTATPAEPGVGLPAGADSSPVVSMAAGEQVATWIPGAPEPANPGLVAGPVGDVPLGEVIARFQGGRWFAWPREPFVWTAPSPGELAFALNGWPAHGLTGAVRVIVVPLGSSRGRAREAFAPPVIALDRVDGGVRVRYTDRAGFGLDLKSLHFTLTTSRGVVFHLAPWVAVAERETVLPLPPPGIPLLPGIHSLGVTIEDRLGNATSPAVLVFDGGA